MKGIAFCRADRVARRSFDIFLALILLAVAYPLIYTVSSSFSSASAIITGRVTLWPVDITLIGYRTVFRTREVWTGYANSFYYTALGVAINLAMTCMAAYPLSRKDLGGRGPLMGLFTFTMFFGGGMIPNFLLVRDLGLLNTAWAIVLPGALSVYNMILARTYFQTNMRDELLESAQIDGCGDARFLLRIVLPLSKPILAVLGLYYAVGHWNSYLSALLYLSSASRFPLQIVLRDILMRNQVDWTQIVDPEMMLWQQELAAQMKYALIIVASLPILLAYPFVQKYFVKGVMIGSLKG